ncbi:alpha/beta fold hydrolase [Streptomyces sp. NPDC048612]|uniref:alpha/beta fold hydrolase n=1 Tax=Streptomyces sp. NPDC048612 TaxID=3365579 RepID=UPI003719A78F
MPRLAERFRVIAVDPRGVGPSDRPHGGYDTGTVAAELVALMRALGHERFAMVGHDVGMWLGYALAADHRDALERLALLRRHPPRPRARHPALRHRGTERPAVALRLQPQAVRQRTARPGP